MKIAWLSFELCARMEMAAASIDEACSIKVARQRILDRIRSALNILEKLLEEATDLWGGRIRSLNGRKDNFLGNEENRTDSKEVDQASEKAVVWKKSEIILETEELEKRRSL
jgi:hypothetical protein